MALMTAYAHRALAGLYPSHAGEYRPRWIKRISSTYRATMTVRVQTKNINYSRPTVVSDAKRAGTHHLPCRGEMRAAALPGLVRV